jgi:hypothetical protein
MTRSAHIELSKAGALAHTWGRPGIGRAFGSAFLLPLFLDGGPYSISEFYPHQAYRDFFRRLPIGAAAAIHNGDSHETS